MSNNERHLLVMEIKGLLKGIVNKSRDASFQLASDNLTDIVCTTSNIRQILDRIDAKVGPMIEEELMEDELY